MPYIKEQDRIKIDDAINNLILAIDMASSHDGKNVNGMMNYTFTRVIHSVYHMDNPSYNDLQDANGLLECVKQELYRRKAVPYEDKKIEENGDV